MEGMFSLISHLLNLKSRTFLTLQLRILIETIRRNRFTRGRAGIGECRFRRIDIYLLEKT